MKKDLLELRQTLKFSLFSGLALFLISCNGDEKKEVVDEQTSISTEATGRFGGDAPSGIDNALVSDFAAANYFENSDMNNDNMLDKGEFAGSFFNTWDVNNDNRLDKNEWSTATNDFGFEANNAWDMAKWDANNDNTISKSEFTTGLGTTDTFASWDKNNDNMLDETEYSEGIVILLNDADDDGVLDDNEYREKVNRYFDNNEKQYQPERG